MSRFSRKNPTNTAPALFDPFNQPEAQVTIVKHITANGKVMAAFTVAEMLEACGIDAPEGVYFPTGKGKVLICGPKPTKAEKPNPDVLGSPLATIAPEKMLAALLARMSPADISALTGQPAMSSATPAKAMRRKAG